MRKLINILSDKMFLWELNGVKVGKLDGNQNTIRMNPFSLVFPKALEAGFLKDYYEKSVFQIKISLFVGAILFSSFLALDLYLVPELFTEFLFLRIGLGLLIMTLAVIIINKSANKAISQPILSLTIILLSTLLISLIVIASPKLNSTYFIGIILLNFWSFTFLKLRYIWASVSGYIVLLIYVFISVFNLNLEFELLVISTSHLLASTIAGSAIAYALEYYSRRDYLQTLMLKSSLDKNISLSAKIYESDRAKDMAEERLMLQSKALESAANSIVILDREGNIIWCNPAFLYLTGYELNEVIGNNPRFLKSGKHDKVFYKNLWSTVLKGRVWSGEIINKKKDGNLYYEEMMITPVIDSELNKITHFIAIKQDITLRKDMEDELFESEKRFRGLFENATMGIYRSLLDGDIIIANNALIEMLGFDSFEELRNRDSSTTGYVNPNQRDEFINKLKETGNIIGFESEWRKKDGSTIFIRETSRLDHDENGELIFEGTVEDITLSKLAEAELRESEDRLRTVFDNLNDAIIIHDINGRVVKVNNKVLDLYNISMEHALSLSVEEISSKENQFEAIYEYWESVLKNNKTYRFEWKAMRPTDKFFFDVEVLLSKITLGNDDLIIANIRDITEQKEANKKLLLTQKAVEMNATPIYWLSNNADIIYVNNAGVKMLGYSLYEFTQMKIPDIDPLWDQNYWDRVGYPRLKEKKLDQFETMHRTKDGKDIAIEVSSSLIDFEGEEIVVAVVSDITERINTAKTLLEAKEKAEKSNKLKSEFLAGMSHEIRTPINTILNFISLIRSDLGNTVSDDISSSFEMIDNGSRRLIRTIDSILNMSQLQSGTYELRLEKLSVMDDVLNQIMSELKPIANQKNLEFSISLNTEETEIYADQYTVSQLLINLIDNALKYTEAGSINIAVESEKEHVIVNIIDTGIGISKEFLPTLFDPFVQEEMGYTRSFEGTGLGLALVKNYVELNNGEIAVSSSKGEGSTFSVKFRKPPN
jgi:PAS domain S-box-containing protein